MAETVRVWLVERSYGTDEDLVTLVYATPDGDLQVRKQLSHAMLRGKSITAARDVDPERLDAVRDDDLREQYTAEARRMADRHDPDETV